MLITLLVLVARVFTSPTRGALPARRWLAIDRRRHDRHEARKFGSFGDVSGGDTLAAKRLPFTFQVIGSVGRLALTDLTVGPLVIDRLELEVADFGTDP